MADSKSRRSKREPQSYLISNSEIVAFKVCVNDSVVCIHYDLNYLNCFRAEILIRIWFRLLSKQSIQFESVLGLTWWYLSLSLCLQQKLKEEREAKRAQLDGRHDYVLSIVASCLGLEKADVEDAILEGTQVEHNTSLFHLHQSPTLWSLVTDCWVAGHCLRMQHLFLHTCMYGNNLWKSDLIK